ncbi:hypothetical protein KAJ83_18220 [Marivibrio halodurans]|uniref:Uncharacterized protein n=1 Tax=Marivibrio halodurans TaxID=2039722 RepID=A0A8J7V2M1_9PROT|nr:hypothetical protein [Marivibrio halodurans]MBP5858961.1 hypothetical protein [Marivibrio halodurans]
MSDPSGFPSGSGRLEPRAQSNAGRIAPGPAPTRPSLTDAADKGPGAGRRGGGGRRDPFDIDGAMARLKTLLAFDGGRGPRDGVPRRGFYLNILS